jgi:hypothetical protein
MDTQPSGSGCSCAAGQTLHAAVCSLGTPSFTDASRPHCRSEATLYIRGFMSSAKEAGEQTMWRRNHEQVVQSRGWSHSAFDFQWQHYHSAGLPDWFPGSLARGVTSLGYYPLPVCSSAAIAGRLSATLRGKRPPRLCRRPAGLALAVATDVLLGGGRVYAQWRRATAHARGDVEVERLQGAVLSLRRQGYSRVRVVAYSLGCRLALHACKQLPHASRPDEVHLLAAAVEASEARSLLSGLTKNGGGGDGGGGSTHVYFSRDDQVLNLLYGVAEGSPALGFEGLALTPSVALDTAAAAAESGEGGGEGHVEQHDTSVLARGKVSEANPLAVHLMYSRLWGEIACGGGGVETRQYSNE